MLLSIANVADAMQNNTEVLAAVKELEDKLTDNKDTEIKLEDSVIDADGMTVVGAAFNAASGSAVSVNISLPKVAEKLDEMRYENAVQLDITLMEGNEAIKGEFKVPVTITMKLPEAVESDGLVILHYLPEGMETIYPVVNGDGTVTFSTTSFSTFVFANMVYYGEVELPNDDTPDVPDTPDTPDEPDVPDTPDTPVIPDIPTVPDVEEEEEEYDPLHWIKYSRKGKAGWQKVSGTWYYFAADGDLKTGWVEDTDGKWYYMDAETGKMQTGWVLSKKSGLWYYKW